VGGPEVDTLAHLARRYLAVLGGRKTVIELPLPGKTARAIRGGALTCPENRYGRIRWEDFLRERLPAAGPAGIRGAAR